MLTMFDLENAIARNLSIARASGGQVFYVGSTRTLPGGSTATDSDGTSYGRRPDYPFSTLDYAIGQCSASRGDTIFVLPGHVETVAAAGGLAIDVAGLTIIGLGRGALRPQINFTATGSTCTISAANTYIENVLFTGGIDAVATAIVISAADVTLKDIEGRDVTGQMTNFITTTAAANRLMIDGFIFNGASAAGGATCISIVGGDGITIRNFRIFGNFSTAAIQNVTTACTNITIGGGDTKNFIQNGLDNAAVVAITMVATSTGFIGPDIHVRIGVDSTSNTSNITEALVGAAMQFMLPLNICNLGGEVAMAINITASTDDA